MEIEIAKSFQKSSPTTCKHWINDNCPNGDACQNLHWWIDTTNNLNTYQKNGSKGRLISWRAPPRGFVKINCDGGFRENQMKGSAGRVVRNCEGEFIFSFFSPLKGVGSAAEAELYAMKIGMETTISRGYKNLIVESDSQTAVQLINMRLIKQTHPFYHLVSSIIQMADMVDCIHWNHVLRETNSVADALAKYGLSLCLNSPVVFFQFPPPFLLLPLCADQLGTVYSR